MIRTNRVTCAIDVFATAACLMLTGLITPAAAELHPGSYDESRIKAAEALVIQVSSVEQTIVETGKTQVTLNARVLSAERSESGLVPGESIVITYLSIDPTKLPPGWVGGRPTPILEQDGVYPAFLKLHATGASFEPAAFGWSFRMTPSEGRP